MPVWPVCATNIDVQTYPIHIKIFFKVCLDFEVLILFWVLLAAFFPEQWKTRGEQEHPLVVSIG